MLLLFLLKKDYAIYIMKNSDLKKKVDYYKFVIMYKNG